MSNEAPDRRDVVAAVIAAHPEVDSRDEVARGAIVDWAAQRLNREDGSRVWGRKSRGKPNVDVAVNPNTDGITYLRSDGRFEIIDAINGGDGSATWENYGPFDPGANGWWAPPQLGPEPGAAPPPTSPPVTPPTAPGVSQATLDAAIAAVRAELRDGIAMVNGRIDVLPPAVVHPDALRVAIDGALAGYEVNGRSERSIGHQHTVKLVITKRKA